MAILPGERVTAARLNRLQPKSHLASCTTDLPGPVANTDLAGATITLTTETAGAIAEVEGVFDCDTTGAGTTTAVSGQLVVDGAAETGVAVFHVGAATANDRSTVSQIWRVVLGAAGSHTLKLQGASVPTNLKINAIHTQIKVTITEVV